MLFCNVKSQPSHIALLIAITVSAAALTSACTSDNTPSNATSHSGTPAATDNVTSINGEVPPGKIFPLQSVRTMLDTTDAHGQQLIITMGTRLAGTRMAIHSHQYGGTTCVISGVITDFVQGQEPKKFPAGTCYYMPPNTLMSAANLGSIDVVLIDTFTTPPQADTTTMMETVEPTHSRSEH